MTYQFKVGEKVRIKKKYEYCGLEWVDEMDEYIGKVGTIVEIGFSGIGNNIRTNLTSYYFNVKSLAPVLEIGDEVIPSRGCHNCWGKKGIIIEDKCGVYDFKV